MTQRKDIAHLVGDLGRDDPAWFLQYLACMVSRDSRGTADAWLLDRIRAGQVHYEMSKADNMIDSREGVEVAAEALDALWMTCWDYVPEDEPLSSEGAADG